MNQDSQNPTQEPDQNTGMGDMPQVPTTGTGDDQGAAPAPMPPAGGDNGGEAPEAPEAPTGGDAPEAPAPEEGDKEDGGKW